MSSAAPTAPGMTPAQIKLFSLPALKPGPVDRPLPSTRLSNPEAQAKRREWQPPLCFEGEPVWYRARGAKEDVPARILRQTDKSFSLHVDFPNRPPGPVHNVAYFDWDYEAFADPMWAYLPAGTFRKSQWAIFFTSKLEAEILLSQAGLDERFGILERKLSNAPAIVDVVPLREKVDDLERRFNELRTLIESLGNSAPPPHITAVQQAAAMAHQGQHGPPPQLVPEVVVNDPQDGGSLLGGPPGSEPAKPQGSRRR